MNIEPHVHQEFHFAENTDSKGFCCCWKSNAVRPKEYYVDKQGIFHGRARVKYRQRIIANQRLGEIIKLKFDEDPIENNRAFEILVDKINDPMKNGNPITPEKLAGIVIAIHELKREISEENKNAERKNKRLSRI